MYINKKFNNNRKENWKISVILFFNYNPPDQRAPLFKISCSEPTLDSNKTADFTYFEK